MTCDEMVGKTLDDVMKEIPDDEVVHIGSGSSFLFIGTKEDYARDIKKVSAKCIRDAKRVLDEVHQQIKRDIKALINPNITVRELPDLLCRLRGRVEDAEKMEAYLKKFVAISKRTVKEAYPSIVEDGIVLIIEGREVGKYWMLSEYRRDNG